MRNPLIYLLALALFVPSFPAKAQSTTVLSGATAGSNPPGSVTVAGPGPSLCGPLLVEVYKPVKIKRKNVPTESGYAVASTHPNWALVFIPGVQQPLQMECIYLDFSDAL
jgi:hypothetical protein